MDFNAIFFTNFPKTAHFMEIEMFSNLFEKVLRYFAGAKKLTGSVSAACGQLTLNLTTSSYCCNYTDILGATSELQYCIFFKISHNPPNQGLNYFF